MSILDNIKTSSDIKKLSINELQQLASEIRLDIIKTVATNGGHLASNLGAVELTIALHYVFNFPIDKVIFDVGHQCYTHKLLTGRKDKFSTLRTRNGISGFPKREESEYDSFNTGHSGTAISAGAGMAIARDLNGDNYQVISVVGDASLTNGLSLEAINDIGARKTKQIIILNDNSMSISRNVGAMSYKLDKLRQYGGYKHIKNEISNFLDGIDNDVEKNRDSKLRRLKNGIKYALLGGALFEEFGLKYYGPIDGHNLHQLIDYMKLVQQDDGPVVLHVVTKKGKGCIEAENNPSYFHGISANFKGQVSKESYSSIMGDELTNLAEYDEKIVAVTAAMKDGTGLTNFGKRLPNRLIDVGITEEHATVLCAGLATANMKPYFVVYSSFLQRGFDQLLIDVSAQKLPVRFCIDRSGIVSEDGETHQGIYDISYMGLVPNMVLLAPLNYVQLKQMLAWSKDTEKSIAIKYPRGSIQIDDCGDFVPYKWNYLKGNQCAKTIVLVEGPVVTNEAKKLFDNKLVNNDVALVVCPTILPLDKDMINSFEGKRVIVVEDNVKQNGLGSMISSYLNENHILAKVISMSIETGFLPTGTTEELLKYAKLDSDSILKIINNKE